MKNIILTLLFLSFNYLNAFENGNFDGDDSAWTRLLWTPHFVQADTAQTHVRHALRA